MMLPAGKRDAYLTMLRESASTPDSAGQLVETYTKIADVWANIVPKSASEDWKAYHMEPSVTHMVTIPWTTALVATDRFTELLHGKTYIYNVAGPPISGARESDRRFGFETIVPVYEVSS